MVGWVDTGTSRCACDHGRGIVLARAVEDTHFSSSLERKRDLAHIAHSTKSEETSTAWHV